MRHFHKKISKVHHTKKAIKYTSFIYVFIYLIMRSPSQFPLKEGRGNVYPTPQLTDRRSWCHMSKSAWPRVQCKPHCNTSKVWLCKQNDTLKRFVKQVGQFFYSNVKYNNVKYTGPLGQYRSLHSRVRFDPESVPWCQTHLWVRPTRKPGQTDPESESEDHFDSDFVSVWPRFRINLTQKRVWPHGTLSGSNLTREFL